MVKDEQAPVTISIVIPVKDSMETLPRCLSAIEHQKDLIHEIIVVDDGSEDASISLARQFEKVRVVATEAEGRGVSRARNKGAKEATGDIVFFIDSDIVLSSEVMQILADQYKNPEIVAVVGLLDPDSEYKNFSSDFKNLWMYYTYRVQPRETALFYTSIASIRRSIFLDFGGFDESYKKPGLEDTDFGNRLYGKGCVVHLNPDIMGLHLKHYTLGQLFRLDFNRAIGLVKIQLRHGLPQLLEKNLSSVPETFILSIIPAFAAVLCLLPAVFYPVWWTGVLFSILATCVLNMRMLRFFSIKRGPLFTMKVVAFLIVDSIFLVGGIIKAFIDYSRGKQY